MSKEDDGFPFWLKVVLFLALVALILYALGKANSWLPW